MAGLGWMTSALRRERILVLAALLAAVAMSWVYLLNGAGMNMHDMGGMLMPMRSGPWTLGYAVLALAMWAVMMAAMMLPSAAPMILLYDAMAQRQRAQHGSGLATGAFVSGYLAIWALFSLGAVVAQFGLEQVSLLSPMLQATSVTFASAVFVAAGIYQWTPLKQACLRRCRSPLQFVLSEWRPGKAGAFVMGLRHGAYCLGCCWVLMLLLFVGGVMNLAWIAGLALFVLVEKLAPAGHWIGRIAGAGLIAWGISAAASVW